jgi:hypothetical protein
MVREYRDGIAFGEASWWCWQQKCSGCETVTSMTEVGGTDRPIWWRLKSGVEIFNNDLS